MNSRVAGPKRAASGEKISRAFTCISEGCACARARACACVCMRVSVRAFVRACVRALLSTQQMHRILTYIDHCVTLIGVACFLFRYGCGGGRMTYDACEYVATYRVVGSLAHFELSARASWVAIGFSSDDKMVGNETIKYPRSVTDCNWENHTRNLQYNHW